MKKLSIIIPAFNEERTISSVINSVAALEFGGYDFSPEIIIVDDGSEDRTFDCARETISSLKMERYVKLIRHPLNRGKGAAIRTALETASGDIIAIQDADLEYNPSDILRLSSEIAGQKADVIYGSRFLKKNPVIYGRYYLGNKLLSAFISLLFLKKVTDAYTCRKIFKSSVLKKIKLESDGFEIEAELTAKILRSGAVYREIPIDYTPRTIKEGKKISLKDAFKGFATAIKYRFMSKEKIFFSDGKPGICILSARFYPHLGGTEKQALELARLLRNKKGYDVMVVTQRYLKDLPTDDIVNGIKVYRLGSRVGKTGGFFSSVIFMAQALVFLLRHREEYGVIQVLLASSPALVGCLAGMILKNKKVVVKLGGARLTGDIATSRKTLAGRLKLFLLKKSDAVFVCPSDEVRMEALDAGFKPERLALIPNGVDVEKFTPVRDDSEKKFLRGKLGIPTDAVVVTYIGRFASGKGIEILIDGFCQPEIEKRFPGVFLVLAGDGELKRYIEKRIGGRKDVLVTPSAVENPSDYLKASDIFVLPSSGEGLSNALLEAMSSGLSVIASDISSNRQIISDGKNGILFRTNDPSSIINALSSLITDEKLRRTLGRAARKTVVEDYNITGTADKYEKLYSEISGAVDSSDGRERFGFGSNWQKYSLLIDEERIKRAEESLKKMLGISDLRGLTFIDVGCGSGLFSLAAMRMGAALVRSFDYDRASVECALSLKNRFYPSSDGWMIERGSILDDEYVKKLGRYDIVYSWGVLHHTGNLKKAMENVSAMVRENGGLLFIAIYNTQRVLTPVWKIVKKRYVRGSWFTKKLLLGGYVFYCLLRWFVSDILRLKNPLARWQNYKHNRGMSFVRDAEDWVGGYPFETATIDDVRGFYESRGFTLLKAVPSGGSGNNEFVFKKL